MWNSRKRNIWSRHLYVIGMALIGLTASAVAQTWPTKPIQAIVPYSAGGAADIIARTAFDQLAKQLGQPIVVENRLGAGGTIATATVARANPDGYTILIASSAHTITPSTYPDLPYDAARDFAAVIPLGTVPNVLVISPAKGIRSIRELVAAAKADPGSMNYASVGPGSAAHLNAERFRLSAGFEALHIPFKGAPQALTEVMTGRVDFYFSPLLPAIPLIRDGRLTALAVSSSGRVPEFPDIPTTVEAGFPNSEYNFWFGIFVPAKTPRQIVERLSHETAKALQTPSVQGKLSKLGAQPMRMTPDEFDAYVRTEIDANAALVRAAGIGGK